MSRGAPQSKPPHGYKVTDLGYIPEDWSITPLGQLIHSVEYGSSAKSDSKGEIPVLRMGNLQGGRIDWSDLVYTSRPREISRYSLQAGDVLFNRTNTIDLVGKTSLYEGEREAIFAGYLIRIKVVAEHIDARFLNYILNTPFARRYSIKVVSLAVGQANINAQKLKTYPVPLPQTMKEQKAIAEALSDMDGLIGALEKLIAKKRAIKQAAMQQLLIGKTRLPGFQGKWEVKRLGDCLTFLRNGVNSRAELSNDGDVRYLHYGDVHGSHGLLLNPIKTPMPYLPHAKAGRLDRLKDGDLIFADASEDLDGIGKAIEIQGVENVELVSGLHTIAVRFDKTVLGDSFKVYLQFIPSFRAHLRQLAAGTKVYATNRAHIAGAEVALPSVDEQTAIATVLSDIDAEIEALEQRRDKTKQIKQGMMQQLLTGRIRLVKPDIKTDEKSVTQPGARQANVHFIRSVLAAEIIDQLHEQPTFGHVKFEKMIFLVEHLCEVETGSTYHRKAAGPYDNRALRSIDSQLRAQQWFDARKEGNRYQYVPMQKRGGHKHYFDRYFSGIGESFDKILGAFKTLDTERCEIVATLLAAWSDLLRDKGTVSDELIVHEVLNNWHESKRRIPEDRWLKALGWMRSQGFVPKRAS
jgi:restriction endonuclease S subunit